MRPPGAQPAPAVVAQARRELRAIVAARDLDALLGHVRDATKWTFGGDEGRAGFDTAWRDGDGIDRFWGEIDRVLALGGRWTGDDGGYQDCAPYVSCDALPDGFDPFTTVVVLGEAVAVRAGPSASARLVARVDHAVLATPVDGTAPQDWAPVELASGQQGYVAARWVRSPIDYRLGIAIDAGGRWWIAWFIAGE